jgi:hypothetical protein
MLNIVIVCIFVIITKHANQIFIAQLYGQSSVACWGVTCFFIYLVKVTVSIKTLFDVKYLFISLQTLCETCLIPRRILWGSIICYLGLHVMSIIFV